MSPELLAANASRTLDDATIPQLPRHYRGKVRDNYDLADGRRVIIASDPSGLKISWPVYLALQAACLWACSTVLLRKTAMQEKSIVQMTVSNTFFFLMTGCMLLFSWKTPTLTEAVLLAATGMIGGLAQFAFFEGMRRAPVSVIAPFEYTALVWAFLLGYLIWGDVPKPGVFIGATLIIGAGLVIIVSERFGRRATA